MLKKLAVVGACLATLIGGGIALAGNASAADNTVITFENIVDRALSGGASVRVCAKVDSGSEDCGESVPNANLLSPDKFNVTLRLEVQDNDRVTVRTEVVDGESAETSLLPVSGGVFKDMHCFAQGDEPDDYVLQCDLVEKR